MKKLITLLAVALALSVNAQEQISFSVHQDVRLAIVGNDKKNTPAGTIDLLFRFKMQGKQQKHGYMIVFPEFEYAEIYGNYKRYSVNAGYTFNKLVVDNAEINITGSYGFIDRFGKSMFSWGASSELAYKLSDKFKVSLIAQFTERRDLLVFYGKNEIIGSGFLGLEYTIF